MICFANPTLGTGGLLYGWRLEIIDVLRMVSLGEYSDLKIDLKINLKDRALLTFTDHLWVVVRRQKLPSSHPANPESTTSKGTWLSAHR